MKENEHTGPVDRLTWTFSRVMMWGPAFIVAIIFYEVVMRYIFFKPTLWVNEMSLWVGGMIFVTAGLYSMQQRSHIRIFILYDIAPLWLQRVFDMLSTLCVLIFALAVIWGGFGEATAKFARWEAFGTAWDPPIPATNKPLVLVTVAVLAMQALSNLFRDWPAHPIARKTFDVLAAAIVVIACLYSLPMLFASEESGMRVPMHWRLFIGALMLAAIALSIYGLVRDFNHTPKPVGAHDADDEDLPAQVLSGDPPVADRPDQDGRK